MKEWSWDLCAQSQRFKNSVIKLSISKTVACLIVGKSLIVKDRADVHACETPRQRCLTLRDRYCMIVRSDNPNLIQKRNPSHGAAFSSLKNKLHLESCFSLR